MPNANNILALLAYEYIVTFGDEVNLFWAQKITTASILFIANRYIALCTGLMYLPYDVPLKASTLVSIVFTTTEGQSSTTEVGDAFSSVIFTRSPHSVTSFQLRDVQLHQFKPVPQPVHPMGW